MSYYHICDSCGTVNIDSELRSELYCAQTNCGWHPEKSPTQNKKTGTKLRLLTDDEVNAYYHANAPVGLPDHEDPKAKPQPLCTICQQPVPFPVHPSAPAGIDWRCSDACALAQPA